MKSGYTLSWAWLFAAILALCALGGMYGYMSWQLDTQEKRATATRAQLDDARRAVSELGRYTPASLEVVRNRVEAIRNQLVPADRAEDLRWIGRDWTATIGNVENATGYDRIPVTVEKVGSVSMSEWGAILRDLEFWEKHTGVVIGGLYIQAAGNETNRIFSKITLTLDIYAGKKH